MINEIKLLELLELGEDSITEFKQQFSDTDSISAEICALLNFKGGLLLFGVADDGAVLGLDDKGLSDIKQKISDIANHKIRPACNLGIYAKKLKGKKIIVIAVPDNPINKPYADTQGRYWLRVGDTKRKMPGDEMRRIAMDNSGRCTDEQGIHPLNIDNFEDLIDTTQLNVYLDKRYSHLAQKTIADKIATLHKINLAVEGVLNLAGFMLFCRYEASFRADLVIKMVCYKTNEQADGLFTDQALASGSLHNQLKSSLNFCANNLKQIQPTNSFNVSVDEINQQALEEIIINAMVHREYGIKTPIRLFIFPNRLELISPGVLPNHLNEETALNGNSVARNSIIASHAYHILPYRGTGTGLGILQKKCPNFKLENDLDNYAVKITIPRDNQP